MEPPQVTVCCLYESISTDGLSIGSMQECPAKELCRRAFGDTGGHTLGLQCDCANSCARNKDVVTMRVCPNMGASLLSFSMASSLHGLVQVRCLRCTLGNRQSPQQSCRSEGSGLGAVKSGQLYNCSTSATAFDICSITLYRTRMPFYCTAEAYKQAGAASCLWHGLITFGQSTSTSKMLLGVQQPEIRY
jgi:hypothetical protein